jgi:hypothetical protein
MGQFELKKVNTQIGILKFLLLSSVIFFTVPLRWWFRLNHDELPRPGFVCELLKGLKYGGKLGTCWGPIHWLNTMSGISTSRIILAKLLLDIIIIGPSYADFQSADSPIQYCPPSYCKGTKQKQTFPDHYGGPALTT